MAVVEIHTGIITSPKHAVLTDGALRLWLNGLCWSKEHLTDGFIPAVTLALLHPKATRFLPELLRTLVPGKGPLWHEADGGYTIHDYEQWQETKGRVQERRQQWRDRKNKQRNHISEQLATLRELQEGHQRDKHDESRVTPANSPSDGSGGGSGRGIETSVGSQPGTLPSFIDALTERLVSEHHDSAEALHDRAEAELLALGCTVLREFDVPDRGDGRKGRIDLLVTAPQRVAIELDRSTARQKSLTKLESVAGADARVVLLREAPCGREVVGRVHVIGLGSLRDGRDTELFERFWQAYPRRTARPNAERAWAKLKADEVLVDAMLAAIAWQRRQPSWTKDAGAFIPHPATWLNQRRWEDEHPDGALNGTLLDEPPVDSKFDITKPYEPKTRPLTGGW